MKKVLIVSYYWPPSAGSGVQRWLKFSKFLPQYGWQPIIYTPEAPHFGLKDSGLSEDIPPEAEVWKSTIWEPYDLKDRLLGGADVSQNAGIIRDPELWKNRLLNWIRGNVFVPDPRVFWVKPSVKILRQQLAERAIDAVVTTGPPHSMHLIGLGLKRRLGVKWIADFRDPWSESDVMDQYLLTEFTQARHRKLEREVLRESDICLTVSRTWADSFKRLGARRVEVITNGFDEEDRIEADVPADRFVVGHYGLLNHLRNPRVLWDVLNTLCEQHPRFDEELEIHVAGVIDTSVLRTIEEHSLLKSRVRNLGYLKHDQVIREYSKASVLLLMAFDSASGSGNIPAKVFEYLATGRPILGFGPRQSDLEKIILETESGKYHPYDTDRQALSNDLMAMFEHRERLDHSEKIQRFSRRNLTKELADILDG